MKTLVSITLCCLLASFSVTATFAQGCFGTKIIEGGGFEMTNLTTKGKPDGVVKYKFTSVRQEGPVTVIDVEMESVSKSGKSEFSQKFTIKCSENEAYVDAASMVSQDQMKSLESFNMSFTSTDIVYPVQLSVGQTLKDASLNGKGDMSGIAVTFDMNITDRKVAGQEKIAVGAGQFDTYKITSNNKMSTKTVIPVNLEFQTVSYRAPGVLWDIKTETYRKGKLIGQTELSKIY